MYKLKSLFMLLLAICLAVVMVAPVSGASTDKTIDQKAQALNNMGILKGTGNGFNLDSQLQRSEAASFIVRILGKENEVLSNKAQYISSKFSDIKPDAWYAPYIGYCVQQGIISGYPDGKFHPDEFISEKSFLKIALCALGYKFGKDFTWDTVFENAYGHGLELTEDYLYKKADNVNFKRSGTVYVLYNALRLVNINTGLTTMQNLVNTGAVPRNIALAEGLLKDDTVTAVTSVKAENKNGLTVNLNEQLKTVSGVQITDSSNNPLSVSSISLNGSVLTVATGDQTADKDYNLKVVGALDSQGNIVTTDPFAFKGYKNPIVTSDYFYISQIVPVDKSTVNIYFTQPISAAAEFVQYYSLKKNGQDYLTGSSSTMKLKVIPGVNNGITLFLNGYYFDDGAQYTLTIAKDLRSIYGQYLGDGSGESADFTAVGVDRHTISVVNVTSEDKRTVVVEFDTPVDTASAQTAANFTIKKSGGSALSVLKAAVNVEDPVGKIVRLSTNQDTDPNQIYTVTIKNIYDYLKVNKVSEQSVDFAGGSEAADMNVVSYAEAVDNTTLYVYSNRPFDPGMASQPSLYIITGVDSSFSAVPATVLYDRNVNPYLVKLYLPTSKQFASGKQYKLSVTTTLRDYLYRSNNTQVTFAFSGSSYQKPGPDSATIIGPKDIKVTFSKEIAGTGNNISASNYWLEYQLNDKTNTIRASSVSYINSTTIMVRFSSNLDLSYQYSLKFTSIKDYGEQYTTTSSDGYNSIGVSLGNK